MFRPVLIRRSELDRQFNNARYTYQNVFALFYPTLAAHPACSHKGRWGRLRLRRGFWFRSAFAAHETGTHPRLRLRSRLGLWLGLTFAAHEASTHPSSSLGLGSGLRRGLPLASESASTYPSFEERVRFGRRDGLRLRLSFWSPFAAHEACAHPGFGLGSALYFNFAFAETTRTAGSEVGRTLYCVGHRGNCVGNECGEEGDLFTQCQSPLCVSDVRVLTGSRICTSPRGEARTGAACASEAAIVTGTLIMILQLFTEMNLPPTRRPQIAKVRVRMKVGCILEWLVRKCWGL